ncbi:MAG TPA: FliA/WhiG family RNA polymerase sigma factor [Gemmatimonadaceae bacterium]|jgi:RNA polymerase sigma factor for flagellar operon FliA|nr:FliA/WhiG family RNA polymerase sigma factor [Gemmatimonadaceae bacterium]
MADSRTGTLWNALASGDSSARDALLTENLSLVHHVARQLARRLSDKVDHDELVSAGILGLMSAMTAFDPERGLAFSTFAVPRIRGAILDELRRQDHVPRSVRRKTRDIEAARQALAARLCRLPDDDELAAELGVTRAVLWKWQSDVESAVRLPLDRPGRARGEPSPTSFLDTLQTEPSEAVDEQIGRDEEIALLRKAILDLREQERTVLGLYYFEGLKIHEIAQILGVTDSRVSQVRSKALARLREMVGAALVS